MRTKSNMVLMNVPEAHVLFCQKRVLDHVKHYGKCILGMSPLMLAVQCYTQGVLDMMQLKGREQPEPEYSI